MNKELNNALLEATKTLYEIRSTQVRLLAPCLNLIDTAMGDQSGLERELLGLCFNYLGNSMGVSIEGDTEIEGLTASIETASVGMKCAYEILIRMIIHSEGKQKEDLDAIMAALSKLATDGGTDA